MSFGVVWSHCNITLRYLSESFNKKKIEALFVYLSENLEWEFTHLQPYKMYNECFVGAQSFESLEILTWEETMVDQVVLVTEF